MTEPAVPLKVLVADDDDVDRERLVRLLHRTRDDVQCVEAASGRDTLGAVQADDFDVVFLDYRLGDALGTDLLSEIRQAQQKPCPVIMVTGYSNERGAVEAMRQGVYDYLAKGNLKQELVAHAIEGSRRWAEMEMQLRDAQDRLRRLSLFDTLTGLPNRNLFFDRLEQALARYHRTRVPFALLMVDLDLFKEINDSYGHHVGDKLLEQVGQRLGHCCREGDTFARLGGDEFAGLLLGADCASVAAAAAERITAVIEEPLVVDGHVVRVSASLGIALCPQHGMDTRTLVTHADSAMYSAKRAGNNYEIFTPEGAPVTRPVQIGSRLEEALEKDELTLHYQPKVKLLSGELVGMEALVRWNSPVLGDVSPGEFIPLAERTTVIHPLTTRVLTLALDQQRDWLGAGLDLSLAVNLSARALDDDELPIRVLSMLAERGLAPQRLTLEVTETALMDNPEQARKSLSQLSQAGVSISIDDFGVGYTSLRHLRELAVSEIKVDKLFVSELRAGSRDTCIIRSLAELSQGFGARLVAEGIERKETLPLLSLLGCHVGQGYGIARPMPADEVPGWCSRGGHLLSA